MAAHADSQPRARRWGTISDAAVEATVSAKTIRRQIAAGVIYAERISPRRIRVDLDSISGRALTIAKADR
ncbi:MULTISPECIES: DNA-binding protein [unclassified Microbacterium]|uniref:DNA-binding protein n=1 Tax=unclassified Microbacterium TaxID=2609290 RepID=UPI0012FA96D4|nr:DNA-binding protein [Microbacterium sp. MAH-37]MVQ42962.1 DNA-binding protein [Microbacterium sp. MAH-37]